MILTIEITPKMTYAQFREIAANEYLKYTLQRASGSMIRAAKLAGMNRTAFSERVARAKLTDYARNLRDVAVDLRHKMRCRLDRAGEPGVLAR